MRLVPIASGSSGNCIYVGSDSTHLLVDIGISAKRAVAGLEEIDIKPDELSGILITHEHSDHISGLGVFSRKYGIPVYASEGTIRGIKEYDKLGDFDQSLFRTISADSDFYINDIAVNAMNTSHDVYEPLAFTFANNNKRVAIATDLGNYSDYTVKHLENMDAILLEANHDVRMLQVGPYPYWLKRRILSDEGHLSNELSGRLLSSILHDDMKKIVLGHLSKENNMPELAYETVRVEIGMADNKYKPDDFDISVARRDCVSEIIEL